MKEYILPLILLISIPLAIAQDQCALLLPNGNEVDVSCNANFPEQAKPILHYTNRCSFPELIECNNEKELNVIIMEFYSGQCGGSEMSQCIISYYS